MLLLGAARQADGDGAAARERGGRRGGVAARGARPAPVPVAGGGASNKLVPTAPLPPVATAKRRGQQWQHHVSASPPGPGPPRLV
jgi:hypothetical protein